MRIAITGSPGTGKTSVAMALGKKLKYSVMNEKQFALDKGIGKWDEKEDELAIPLKKIEKELNKLLKKRKNLVLEGHLLCEIKLSVDFIVLIKVDPELLDLRLRKKGYREEKIQDNVFCEGIEYCKKHAYRNYKKKKIVEVGSQKTIKETMEYIIMGLKEKGAEL
jgi:adenylate kinase